MFFSDSAIPVWARVAVTSVFVVLALATGLAELMPTAPGAFGVAQVLPIPQPRASAAEIALSRGDAGLAAKLTANELSVSPVRQDAWLRMARADMSQHRSLTAIGQGALEHAYDTVPYDLDPASARLPFALAHFSVLTLSVQQSVRDELGVWAASSTLRRALVGAASRNADLPGRQAVDGALASQSGQGAPAVLP